MLTTDSRAGRISIWISAILIAILLNVTCNPAAASEVERAKTTSVQKVKKFGTKYLICIVTESGKSYRTIYNAHCYKCKVEVPQNWTVLVKRNGKAFIEPIK